MKNQLTKYTTIEDAMVELYIDLKREESVTIS
jgi:hypothetical protein